MDVWKCSNEGMLEIGDILSCACCMPSKWNNMLLRTDLQVPEICHHYETLSHSRVIMELIQFEDPDFSLF